MDKHLGGFRENVTSFWGELDHLYGDSCSGFLPADHFALSGFESIFLLAQGPPLCTHVSFSQGGFQSEGLWEVAKLIMVWHPLTFCRYLSAHVQFARGWGGCLLDLKKEKYVASLSFMQAGLSPSLLLALLLSCSAHRRWNPAAYPVPVTYLYFERVNRRLVVNVWPGVVYLLLQLHLQCKAVWLVSTTSGTAAWISPLFLWTS